MTNPTWTCVTGDVGDWTAEDQWYWDPGEDDREDTCKHECPECGWKFRGDVLWGCTFTDKGDMCPNCLSIVTDDDADDDAGCFSPRD